MATKTATRPARRARTKRGENVRASKNDSRASHHERKCFICWHPERETIEEMFVHWHSPMSIYTRFMLRDRSTIYDHAHATGLFAKRRRNMRCALERIIERADERDISAHGIVAAIKAYASLTASGEWVEPARRVIYTSVSAPAPQREIANPLANQNGRRAYSHALIDPSVTGDGWYTRNERNSNPLANRSSHGIYSAPSDEPDLTGDGWYTRNEKSPASHSATQTTHPAYSNGSPAPYSAPSAANYRNSQPASPNATHVTSSVPGANSAAIASATTAPTASASAPTKAAAPQTTTHASPSPAQTTTTATPTNPKSTSPNNGGKITSQTPNSNRYTSGLKIPATHTKQSPAPHPNRYK
ncbi:MAG: hypothetical protein ACRD37_01830 [Candidatus Acidiferrales bacterium]